MTRIRSPEATGSESGGSHIERGVAAALRCRPGRWIVGGIGLAIVGSGISQLVRGWTENTGAT